MPVKLSDIRSGDESDDLSREKGSAEDSGVPDSSRRPKSRNALAPTSLTDLSSSPYTKAFREAERLKAMLPPDRHGMERTAVALMAQQLAQNESLGMADLAARQLAAVNAAGRAGGVSDSLQEIVRRLAIDNQSLTAPMGPSYSGEQMRAAAAAWRQRRDD